MYFLKWFLIYLFLFSCVIAAIIIYSKGFQDFENTFIRDFFMLIGGAMGAASIKNDKHKKNSLS